MTSPHRIDELPVPLPPMWESGRLQCKENEVAWQPERADLNTLREWLSLGMARITGQRPESKTGDQRYFTVDYEVVGFDSTKEPKWCLDVSIPFECKDYEQCDAILAESGFTKRLVKKEDGLEAFIYTVDE